jgi:hypothetical protein
MTEDYMRYGDAGTLHAMHLLTAPVTAPLTPRHPPLQKLSSVFPNLMLVTYIHITP